MSTTFSPVTAVAPLHIDTSYPTPATALAVVAGEVDMSTAPRLRASLLAALHERTPAILHVDLARVTFLDCAGIGALVGVRSAAVDIECQMWVTKPHPVVGLVLELTGLLGVLTAPVQPAPSATTTPSGLTRLTCTSSPLVGRTG